MNKKIKASIVSLSIISALTLLKFIFYYVSGSIAVLSEAWHSFSDIVTTALVLFSLLLVASNAKKNKNKDAMNPELIASLLISVLLLSVSLKIFHTSFWGEGVKVVKPLLTGFIFIFLSFGSYFLFKFQSSIAESENSSALKADSLHNKADMFISLATGSSLILYNYGIDVDLEIGALISILIFSYSVEMFINVIVSLKSKENKLSYTFTFHSIFFKLFDTATYSSILSLFFTKTGISYKAGSPAHKIVGSIKPIIKKTPFAVGAMMIFFMLFSCLYTVKIDEEALIIRFGKIINKKRPIQAGLHLKLPYPFAKVVKIQSKKIMTIEIGNKSSANNALIWTIVHGDQDEFIAGDNNLFLPYVILNYTIDKPYTYYTKNADPLKALERISYQVLTNIFLRNKFFDLALFKRRIWINDAKQKIQFGVDQLNTGISIESLNIKDLHPPEKVASAFENVIAAYQQKKRMINMATGEKNKKIPRARSSAKFIITDAHSYVDRKIKIAEGEAQSFRLRLEGYETAKRISTENMRLSVVEEVLKDRRKIIYDPRTNISPDILYFEEYLSKKKDFY